MRVALGLKAHSGWAALVVLGARGDDLEVVDRRRIELADEEEGEWARQPYHAALRSDPELAREVVERGIETARRTALREMRAAAKRARDAKHDIAACGVLVSDPLPAWTVEQILAVHFRMHKAEGVLYREALVAAARACRLRLVAIPEKTLVDHAQRALATTMRRISDTIASLGKPLGPPWGKDQKDAALAAMIALEGRTR